PWHLRQRRRARSGVDLAAQRLPGQPRAAPDKHCCGAKPCQTDPPRAAHHHRRSVSRPLAPPSPAVARAATALRAPLRTAANRCELATTPAFLVRPTRPGPTPPLITCW